MTGHRRRRAWRWAEWGDESLAARADAVAADVDGSLRLAAELTGLATGLGHRTWCTFAALATLGVVDLSTARAIEPHLDALAILHQAGSPDLSGIGVDPTSTWGVFAANPPGPGLHARPTNHSDASSHGEPRDRLDGTKPWCSLADRLDHALVTAQHDDGTSGLYALALQDDRVTADAANWVALGLRDLTTSTLTVRQAPAIPIGAPGWYLSRPGFAWGGIGVAAVWFGGAAAVAARLLDAADRRPPDQIALAAIGRADRGLHTALTTLQQAADAIDVGAAAGQNGAQLAARVRAVVADCVDTVLTTTGHALGPAPLAHDAEHARRVADLSLYVRQHHAERDLAALGRLVLDQSQQDQNR